MNLQDKTLSGSIVLIKGTRFLSKQIIFHMKLLALMTGRKPVPYSHGETLVWDSVTEQMYTCGAREKGAEISRAADYYNGLNYIVLKPKVTLTDRENWKLWEAYMMLDPAKYQKGNFLSWITYLKTGWFLTKQGSRRLYCFEMCARISAAIGRWPEGKSLDMVSVFDLIENQSYEKI